MSRDVDRNFVVQQGFEATPPESCTVLSAALLFQPRVVGLVVLAGIVFQSAAVFLILSAALWWSALVPALNPFDHLYNALLGGRAGRPRLGRAPVPRRFSQGMAGTFAGSIAACLLAGARGGAIAIEIVMLAAVAAIALGKLCLGSFVYYLVRGRVGFAVQTLPWGRGI